MLIFTDAQLLAHVPRAMDFDVNSLEGRNVADIFININAQGFLTLPLADTTFQLVPVRNWQATDGDVTNYFIEPDFHYFVVNENGEPDQSVVSVSKQGLITPVGEGTAIVLVTYDAMLCYHTVNVVPRNVNVKEAPAFFSALWPENTGVFVVSVGANQEPGIESNMFINTSWNDESVDKAGGILLDAEHDVLYYDAEKGSFAYTFKPEGVSSVWLATPVLGEDILSFNGFSTDRVTANTDGSYTINVTFGRNIVKLVSPNGTAAYQVITAKPVIYEINNLTNSGEIFNAGDSISIRFNTLYHPSNKLAGIYNMSAGIQYTGENVSFPFTLGPGQYAFASRAQEYRVTIPKDFTGHEFVLTNGVIKVSGFGSFYGHHRSITLQNGAAPSFSANVRTAHFGSLPDIRIKIGDAGNDTTPTSIEKIAHAERVKIFPNPTCGALTLQFEEAGTHLITISDITGNILLRQKTTSQTEHLDIRNFPARLYLLTIDNGKQTSITRIVKY
jgi:hypothetical protein